MFQKIIEIIIFVITELQSKQIEEIDLDKLKNLGYTNSEISTAFSWIADSNNFGEILEQGTSISAEKKYFRILHPAEEDFFTPEARNELIHYNILGLIRNEDIENLIDRNVMSGYGKIDSEDLKTFIAGIIFDAYNQSSSQRRMILLGNETIN